MLEVLVNSSPEPIVLDATGRDVHAEGARIRAQGPVAAVELPGGVRAWSVVGYEMVRKVLTDPRLEALPATPSDRFAYDSDARNAALDRQ